MIVVKHDEIPWPAKYGSLLYLYCTCTFFKRNCESSTFIEKCAIYELLLKILQKHDLK